MKTLRTSMLLALLLTPAAASGQVTHVTEDPVAETERCQNHEAAFHADGDVVRVEYHGQWRTRENGSRIQNGGPKYRSCATERIVRVDSDNRVIWQLRPTDSADDAGLRRIDKVADLVARPDGTTLITVKDDDGDDHTHSTVILLEEDGQRRWSVRTKQAPKFTWAQAKVGAGGEIFVEFRASNFGYSGGTFQLPSGRAWKISPNTEPSFLARVDPENGKILWQRRGVGLVSAQNGEVLAYDGKSKRSNGRTHYRHEFIRLSYDGERLGRAKTSWLTSEPLHSAVRAGDELWMTTLVETVSNKTGGVTERTSKLRVYDLDGKLLHSRKLSDHATLAEPRGQGPMRVVSPSNCVRGVIGKYICAASAYDVLTLSSYDDKGEASRISVGSRRVDYSDFEAVGTKDGLRISAKTYADDAAEATAVVNSPDKTRQVRTTTPLVVWSPDQRAVAEGAPKLRLSL